MTPNILVLTPARYCGQGNEPVIRSFGRRCFPPPMEPAVLVTAVLVTAGCSTPRGRQRPLAPHLSHPAEVEMPWPACTVRAVEGNGGGRGSGVAENVKPNKGGRVLAGQLRALRAFGEA